MHFQIGTEETRGITGSRTAKSTTLSGALKECLTFSKARHVKQAWLRECNNGKLGEVVAVFVKGVLQ